MEIVNETDKEGSPNLLDEQIFKQSENETDVSTPCCFSSSIADTQMRAFTAASSPFHLLSLSLSLFLSVSVSQSVSQISCDRQCLGQNNKNLCCSKQQRAHRKLEYCRGNCLYSLSQDMIICLSIDFLFFLFLTKVSPFDRDELDTKLLEFYMLKYFNRTLLVRSR